MSCEAEAIATASASAATTQMASGSSPAPPSRMQSPSSATWVTAIQPRRRPQKPGT